MGSSRCWLHSVPLIAALFALSSPASAVTIDAVKVNSGNGFFYDTTAKSAPSPQYPAAPTRYHNLPRVPMSPSTLGRLARGAIGGPVGFAVTAAMIYYSWEWDEDAQEFKKVHSEEVIFDEYWGTSRTSYKAATAKESCQKRADALAASDSDKVSVTCTVSEVRSSTQIAWGLRTVWDNGAVSNTGPGSIVTYKYTGEYIQPGNIEYADESDYANVVAEYGSAQGGPGYNPLAISLANNLLSTKSSSQAQQEWPELAVALQTLQNAIVAELQHLQDPELNPPPNQEQIDLVEPVAPPIPPTELPPFCQWASFLCQPFIATAQPEVPMLDIEAPQYDSGLPSSASCPAPVQIVTGFGSWEISYQFACDFASAIKVPLIAISYLVSAFIVVGVRR